MSHVTDVKVEIKDLGCLKRACEKLGLELVEGQKTYRWFGQHMGDYPIPAGFTASDLGKCEHAIRIPGNDRAYEIGVVRRRDGKEGYTFHFDFWMGGYGMEDIAGKDCHNLLSRYSAEVATQAALMQGWTVMGEEVKQDGSVEVLFQA